MFFQNLTKLSLLLIIGVEAIFHWLGKQQKVKIGKHSIEDLRFSARPVQRSGLQDQGHLVMGQHLHANQKKEYLSPGRHSLTLDCDEQSAG